MGYNKQNYIRVKEEYEGKYLRAVEQAQIKKAEIHAVIPEIAEIDRELSTVGLKIFEASVKGDSVFLASNVPHGVQCLEKGIVLDIFTPMREDFV